MRTTARRGTSAVAMLVLAIAIGGCAAGPKYIEVAPTLSAPAPGQGRLYMYRVAVLGAAVQPEVKLNGDVVGRAVPGGFFFVDRPAGEYEVLTSTEVDRKLSVTLEAGQERYVRLNIGIGFFVGHVYPELVEPSVGREEIQDTSYVPPS